MSVVAWPKRFYALDVSRGVAALAVVLWHWQHFAFIGTARPHEYDRGNQPLYSILQIFYDKGSMGVEYFFLLSGFVIFWLYKKPVEARRINFTKYSVQRLSRLYPLHIFTLLLVALLQGIYVSRTGDAFVYPFNDTYHFLLNVGFASRWGFEDGPSFNGPVWAVSIQILLYMAFFIVAYGRSGNPVVCICLCAMFAALFQYLHPVLFKALSLFFLGGIVFYVSRAISNRSRMIKQIIFISTALLWIITVVDIYLLNVGMFIKSLGKCGILFLKVYPYYILFPLTLCSLVLVEIDRRPFSKPISWIGDMTYSMYLLHFPLQLAFALAASYGCLQAEFYLTTEYLLLYFSMLIPLSYFTHIALEKPIQVMIRNKFKSGENAGQYAPG